MNYRHAYHAGNFADVLKHAVLTRVLCYMTQKAQPLRVIDVHAGIGLYDLAGIEAGKTGEWHDGIGRLLAAPRAGDAAALLAPYIDAVASLNEAGVAPRFYPGSPVLARKLLRRSDALIANELHPSDFEALKANLKGSPNSRVMNLDAWIALKSLVPPPERRGVVLIDPPFEAAGEFDTLADGLGEALRRFATGTYVVWYPIKDAREASRFLKRVRALGVSKVINVELAVCARDARPGLNETGLLIINPPYVLAEELATLLPNLCAALAVDAHAGFRIDDWSKHRQT
jgi:23S rRNA (adenine2030-N6)-methyltransferase